MVLRQSSTASPGLNQGVQNHAKIIYNGCGNNTDHGGRKLVDLF